MLADNLIVHLARLRSATPPAARRGERVNKLDVQVVCSGDRRVADRSMQILGGLGMTRDTVVERIFTTRAFRIYDGPSEVHRWALGARIVAGKM
jgi:hypothetical protein